MGRLRNFQYLLILGIIIIPIICYAACGCQSSDSQDQFSVVIESLNLDQATVEKGYTVPGFEGDFLVGVTKNAITEPSKVVLKKINDPNMPLPEGMTLLTDFYEYDIINKSTYDNEKPIYLKIKHNSASYKMKKMMYFDKGRQEWIEIPTKNDPEAKVARAYIHLPYIRLAVFEDQIMETGIASWYEFKDCLCAASPDYPRGTKLKVTNICEWSENYGKSIIVTVNDWGPDRSVHPDRVIDLDLVAFKEIANYKGGLVEVSVELVEYPE